MRGSLRAAKTAGRPRALVGGSIPAPSLSLSSAVTQVEGNTGTSAFVWTLTLNRSGSTASYPYNWAVTASGVNPADTADFGGTFPAGTGTFAPGETTKTITVLVAGDTAVEPDNTFTLTVTAAGLNTVTSTGTISNDDVASTTGFPAATSIVGIGDSFTAGANETDPSTAYLALLGASIGATVLNKGVGGTVLQNTNKSTSGTPDFSNMRDRFVNDCLGANARDVCTIAGGYNDVRFYADQTTFTPEAYSKSLREMIILAITSGSYTRQKLVVINNWWITDTGISTGYGAQVLPSPPRSTFDAYAAAGRAVALEYGTYFFDSYAYLRDNGYVPDSDNVHPQKTANGNKGHVLIRDGLLSQTAIVNTRTSVAGLSAASTVGGQLDTTWTAAAGASSYEVETAPTGSMAYTAGPTPTTNSASVTGLTVGSGYVYRVRPVFSDATKGPWAFYTTATTIAAASDTVTTAYLAAMTVQPDAARKTALNNFIAGLRTDGVLTKMLGIWLGASHDEQAARLNIVNPGTGVGQIATVVGGMTFTANRGYAGNGTTGQLDTGLTFAGHQNDAAMGGYTLTLASATAIDMGNGNSILQFRNTTGSTSIRVNGASGGGAASPSTASSMAVAQTSATAQTVLIPTGDGSGSVAVTSTTPDTNTIRIGGRSGSSPAYSTRTNAFNFMGYGMVGADLVAIRTRITAYLAAIGQAGA